MANKTVAAVVRLIDQFTSPSKQIIEQAKNVEKRFKNMGDTFKNVGDMLTPIGTSLTAYVSAPLAAAGTAAAAFASESQEAFQQFAAATGTATSEMGKYKDMINSVYKENFGESIQDVADNMAKVRQNMSYLDDSALQSVTKYAITLADTFEYDVGESTRAADTLIQNFGVSAREAFNLISQGAQNGLDYSGELMDSINEYSPQFQKLGLGAEEMFAIFSSGAENGAFNLDKIGDAVKEFSLRAVDGSETTRQGFEALGMDADTMAEKFAAGGDESKKAFDQVIKGLRNIKDPVKQNTAGVALFGTMWEDLTPKVVTSLSTTSSAIDMTKESMEALVNTKYDTLTSALGALWRTIQTDVLQPIGNMLIPYVETAIDKVGEFVGWWNSLSSSTQQAIVKFGMIVAAAGPVITIFGKVSSGIGGLITNFGSIASVITKVSGASGFGGLATVLTGPVGIAIAAVAAGAVLIYQNWDRIGPVVKGIGDRFVEFWQNVQPALQPFIEFIQQIAGYISETFGPVVQEVIQNTGDFVVGVFEGMALGIDTLLSLFEGIIEFLSGAFTTDWGEVWTGAADMVGNAFSSLADMVKVPINAVINVVNGAIDKINGIKFTVPEWVPGIGGKGWQGLGIPHIPNLYTGTDYWKGGLAAINEPRYGGEIVDLPRGTRIYPHDESIQMARKEGRDKIQISIAKLADTVVVREESDIDKLADRTAERVATKILEVQANMA